MSEIGIYDPNATSVEFSENQVPKSFSLEQNYPNPFNPSTTIQFTLPQRSYVILKIFDLLGSEVETLVNRELPFGEHQVTFEPQNLASGVYLYKIEVESFEQSKKLILLH